MTNASKLVRVAGAQELARALRRAGADMSSMKPVYKQAADLTKTRVDRHVPHGKTGALARSVRATGQKRKGVVRAGGRGVKYAGVINYGWPQHHIKPSYFMQQGLHEAHPQVLDIITDGLQDIINKIEGA